MAQQMIVYNHERGIACRVVNEFLSERGVVFSVRNVTLDQHALDEFGRLGFLLPPVTVIDGQPVSGDPARLEALLATDFWLAYQRTTRYTSTPCWFYTQR